MLKSKALRGQVRYRSFADTIPNCLGEFREIKERTGIAAYGLRAGTPEATGVERFGHDRTVKGSAAASGEEPIVLSVNIGWFGDILE